MARTPQASAANFQEALVRLARAGQPTVLDEVDRTIVGKVQLFKRQGAAEVRAVQFR